MKNKIKAFLKVLLPVKLQPRLNALYGKVFRSKYKCPFCNSRLRRFRSYGFNFPVLGEKKVIGGGYRPNALCPVCGSLDRERLLYLYLLHKTDIFEKPNKVLHIAPEPRVEKTLRNQTVVDYLTADLYSKDVMIKMDITNIQFPDNSFDVIICNHVLEHVIDDRKAMSELYRVLRPKGWAIVQVPISLSLDKTYEDFSIATEEGREEAFGQMDHVRIYAMDYKDRLEQAGFNINVFKWVTEVKNFGGHKNRFGLNKEEMVFLAKKNV